MALNLLPVIAIAAAALLLGGKKKGEGEPEGELDPEADDESVKQVRQREDLDQGGGGQPVTKSIQAFTYSKATTATGQTVPDPETDPPPSSGDVPSDAYCQDVANWDAAWAAKELEVLAAVNALRAQGLQCSSGYYGPTHALTMNPKLRCSARKHSMDMANGGYFDHTNKQGQDSWDRMRAAGYDYEHASENIAAGYEDLQTTMQQWITSTMGHCRGLMDPDMKEIGIGYFPQPNSQYKHYWTKNFGTLKEE